jgi:hypothetical protein
MDPIQKRLENIYRWATRDREWVEPGGYLHKTIHRREQKLIIQASAECLKILKERQKRGTD